jgi:hypothetical protein
MKVQPHSYKVIISTSEISESYVHVYCIRKQIKCCTCYRFLCDCCEANPELAVRAHETTIITYRLLVRHSVSVQNVTVKAVSVTQTSSVLSCVWNHDSSLSV